jgi:hypothetical protein
MNGEHNGKSIGIESMTDTIMELCQTTEEAELLFKTFANNHTLFPHPDNPLMIYSIMSWRIWNTDFSKNIKG